VLESLGHPLNATWQEALPRLRISAESLLEQEVPEHVVVLAYFAAGRRFPDLQGRLLREMICGFGEAAWGNPNQVAVPWWCRLSSLCRRRPPGHVLVAQVSSPVQAQAKPAPTFTGPDSLICTKSLSDPAAPPPLSPAAIKKAARRPPLLCKKSRPLIPAS